MCIIIIKNNKKLIKTETLMTSAVKNPHGLGVLWLDKWNVTYHDSDEYMILKTQRPYIAHFRYATVGKVCRENCHPFNITDKEILFQNGTVYGLGNKNKTDTQHMAEILADVPRKRWKSILEMNDSRFVTANLKTKKFKIYNEEDWTTKNDIMYSKNNVLNNTLVGVYGTLKKDHSNYHRYLRSATYIGSGETIEKYPMVIQGIPYLLNRPGVGHHVDMDLFLVNEDELMDLDMLEGHPNWYERKRAEVMVDNKVYMPYIYFNDTKDTGEYHKTYTEDIFKWDGGYSYGHRDNMWDDWDDVCNCPNPEPVMDYGDCYCDVCYGTIDKENQIDKLNNRYYE